MCYCDWLAEHLWSRTFTLSEAQRKYVAQMKEGPPEHLAIQIADSRGYQIWHRDFLKDRAREGAPYPKTNAIRTTCINQTATATAATGTYQRRREMPSLKTARATTNTTVTKAILSPYGDTSV
jgi:hypothetical protein